MKELIVSAVAALGLSVPAVADESVAIAMDAKHASVAWVVIGEDIFLCMAGVPLRTGENKPVCEEAKVIED